MRAAAALRAVRRELRGGGGRFAYFAACLAVGVAAVTGVSSLTATIDAGVRAQSRRLLGADLAIEMRRALPPELDGFFARNVPGNERTDLVELPTMASGGARGASQLVELRAVRGRFPLHGKLVTDPPDVVLSDLGDDRVLAARDLVRRLGVGVGGEIRIGDAAYVVAGEIVEEPDRLDFSLSLGPRVLLTDEGLARAGLAGAGSRFLYRALYRLPGDPPREELDRLAAQIERDVPGGVHLDVESHYDAEPVLRRALERVQWLLGLTAVLSLVLGGAGVAQVVRAWIEERTRAIAVLRCLGARPREIAAVAFGHVATLAAAGSAVGALVGALVPYAVSAVAPDLAPPELVTWHLVPILRGFALGLGVALAFATPPILAAWRVPPARVLRAEAAPLEVPRAVGTFALAIVAIAVFLAAWDQAGNAAYAAIFTGGLGAVAGALAIAGAALGAGARRIRFVALPTSIRGGLAAIGRPGAGSLASLAGLGIGVAAVVALVVAHRRIDAELLATLPEDAPSVFLIDVQSDQWPAIETMLAGASASNVEVVPVVMARIAAVDGRTVDDLVAERRGEGRAEWVLTREQRLTSRAEIPASNRVVAGTWWRDDGVPEVSLEEDYAAELRARIGSRVRFDVQGVPLDFTITSLRSVAWESFAINFFWIAEPGPLAGAPSVRLAAARVPKEAEDAFQDRVAAEFPNVTVIRVRAIVERLRGILVRLGLGLRALATFAAIAGTAIVAGAVAAATLRRRREVALLRALGATRLRIVARLAVEYAVAGAAAGVIGAVAGLALAAVFLELVIAIPARVPFGALPIAAAGSAMLAAAAGLFASRPAFAASPLEALRGR